MHDKKKIRKGFIWTALDSFATQIIGLVISLTLARMLGPSVYGLIAMLSIFIGIARVFVESGFYEALIRKTNRNDADLATSFYVSFLLSCFFYLGLYLFSPYIASFYEQPELTLLTRVIALTLIINTFTIVPKVLLSASFNFKAQTKCNITALVISGIIALILAYKGYGVWVLVWQQIAYAIVNTVFINVAVTWYPKQFFSKKSFVELFGFTSKLLLARLLENIYTNLYGLIIGKQYSATQLGLFNQAQVLSSVPAMTITGVIQKVTYPLLSAIQGESKKLDASYLLILQFSALIIFPIMFGICIVAKPLVSILLGSEWYLAAELLSIISMAFVLYPIHAINLNMLQVKGRSDLFLRLEILKKIMLTITLVVTMPLGVKEICFGIVINSYLGFVINTYYTGKLSSISIFTQFKSLLPIFLITTFSALLGYLVGSLVINNYLKIAVTLSTALFFYLAGMFLFQHELLNTLKKASKV